MIANRSVPPAVRIEPWTDADLDLLRRINAPEMKRHLGGPETEEQVLARHRRYLAMDGTGRMFRVVALPERAAVGSIGYWDRAWRGQSVYEMGWSVLPEFQGRGIAVAAVAAAASRAAADRAHRYVHAYPSVDNPASNAVCRKAGFVLIGECDFEYPPGSIMRCNDWRLDLTSLVATIDQRHLCTDRKQDIDSLRSDRRHRRHRRAETLWPPRGAIDERVTP